MKNKKLSKIVDTVAILLLLSLVLAGFMIMKGTVESNAINAEISALEIKQNKNTRLQIGLLSAEIKNLQKDISVVRDKLEKIEQENARPKRRFTPL